MKNFMTVFAIVFAIVLTSATVVAAPISGTKTVGGSGSPDYATLTSAFSSITANGLGGPVTLVLQSGYNPVTETYPLSLPTNGTATNTITVYPAVSGLSIKSSALQTINLNGARYVTIDGRVGGTGSAKDLIIENTALSTGSGIQFQNAASNNLIKYCILKGASSASSYGVVIFNWGTATAGNNNNTIDNCDICDGISTPQNGVYSTGQYTNPALWNSGNTISNCNIFNFFSSASFGIHIASGNTDWTITGNNFYQTAPRSGATGNPHSAIYIDHGFDAGGNNFVITNNFIGGSAPNAGGTAWTMGGGDVFVGMSLAVNTTVASNVQGNTIANFSWTTSRFNGGLPGVWSGIYVVGGNVNVGTASGNTIGSGIGTGSVTVMSSGDGATVNGIGSASAGTVAISNNTIGSITTNASGAISVSVVGIQVTGGTTTISGNTIGSTTTPNSISASNASTSVTAQKVKGISSLAQTSSAISITSNTIANLYNAYAAASSVNVLVGIEAGYYLSAVIGNTIRNLSTPDPGTGTAANASVIGILRYPSPLSLVTISQNVIHSLSNTATTAAVNIIGIHFDYGTLFPNLIERNIVHSLSLSTSSTIATMTGIYAFSNGGTYQNNMVRLGLDASGNSITTGYGIIGVMDVAGTGNNHYFNSVFIGGSGVSSASNTYAFNSAALTNPRIFKNNIFVNNRSNAAGTGKNYACKLAGTIPNPSGLTSNYNLLYANGTGGYIGFYNSADQTTIGGWATATGQDANSLSADPRFIAPNGTSSTGDLHIDVTPDGIVSPAAVRGTAIGGITADVDGDTRKIPPDLGADEFNTYTLNTSATNGTVAKSPNQPRYNSFSTVQLTATPNPSYGFAGWSGDASGSTNPLNLIMDGNKNATANFATTQTITASAGPNGSITPSGSVQVLIGNNQSFTITPNANYRIADVLVDGLSVGAVVSYTFNAVTGTHTIAASFARNTYTLSVDPPVNGSVTPSSGTYDSGTVVQLTAIPATGYGFVSWGGDASGSTNPISITMNSNKTITATFAIKVYSITLRGSNTVVAGLNALALDTVDTQDLISPPPAPGDSLYLYFLLAPGQPLPNYLVDIKKGEPGLATKVKHWSMHAVSAYAGAIATIKVTGSSLPSGFTPTLYDLQTGKYQDIRTNPNFTFTLPSTEEQVSDFLLLIGDSTKPNVAVTSPGGGQQLVVGTPYTIQWSSSDGTGVLRHYVYYSPTGTDPYTLIDSTNGNVNSLSWTPTGGSSAATIKVVARDSVLNEAQSISNQFTVGYTITASAGSNGTISPSGLDTVNYGGSQTFNFTPSTGYHVDSVIVDGTQQAMYGVDVSHFNGTIDWLQVKAAGIKFAFARATDGLAVTDNAFQTNMVNGTNAGIAMGAIHFFEPGQDGIAQAQHFLNVAGSYIGKGFLPPVLDLEVTGGQSPATITARALNWLTEVQRQTGISPIIYTTAPFANNLGSGLNIYRLWIANWGVSHPTLPHAWNAWTFWQYSSSGTVPGINLSVDLDYFNGNMDALDQLTGGNSAVSYTFTNVTANHTIRVTFAINQYTITASTGANGTISPSGVNTLNYGGSQTFNFIPSTWYHVDSIYVDDAYAGNAASYTFSTVTANHTIRVTFALNTYTISTSALAGWNLVSVPVQQADMTPAGVFGDDFGSSVPYYTFQYSSASFYTVPSILTPGQGYWLGSTSATAINAAGTPSSSVTLPLTAGFNIIGNPFMTGEPIGNVMFTNGSDPKTSETKTIADAALSGWLSNVLYQYDGTTYSSEGSALGVWKGYWIPILMNGISIQYSAAVGPQASKQSAPVTEQTSSTHWSVDLAATLTTPDGKIYGDKIASFGVRSDATAGFDNQYDAPRPPRNPSGNYVELSFMVNGDSYPKIFGASYARDYRAPEKAEWEFAVNTSGEGKVTLAWNKDVIGSLNNNVKINMYDMTARKLINMKNVETYTYEQAGTIRKFTISNVDQTVPNAFQLAQNYPNPFNPTTTIRYELPVNSHVTLKLYNLLGQEVKTLVDGVQDAGYKAVQFDVGSIHESILPSGIYYYRLIAGSISETKKMMLLK